MPKNTLTYSGILMMVGGTFLVNALGISDSCSSELTAKGAEYAPLVIGAVMSWIGRVRVGKRVSTLQDQVEGLGSTPRA